MKFDLMNPTLASDRPDKSMPEAKPAELTKSEFAKKLLADLDAQNADAFTFSGLLTQGADNLFREQFENYDRSEGRKHCWLFAATYGGDIHAAYKIVRFIHRRYSKFTIVVPSMCKSAGTLMALGADDIVMFDAGELGPLDVQVLKEGELAQRASGLGLFETLETIRHESFHMFHSHFLNGVNSSGPNIPAKVVMENARAITVGFIEPLLRQIDPNRLGEIQRAMAVAENYGKRLARSNLKDGALSMLVGGYSDHAFAIDIEEARNLFKKVRAPVAWEVDIVASCEQLINPTVETIVRDIRHDVLLPLLQKEGESDAEKFNAQSGGAASSARANGAGRGSDASNGRGDVRKGSVSKTPSRKRKTPNGKRQPSPRA